MHNKNLLTYRVALLFALGISLSLNIIFVIAFFYGRDAVIHAGGESIRPKLTPESMSVHVLSNFILAFLLYILNFRILKINMKSGSKLLLVILSTFALTLLISYLFSTIQMELGDFKGQPARFIRSGIARDSFISMIVLFSSQLVYVSSKRQQTILENEVLRAENMRTRYEALKNQVDPHFLFNSLNTLNSLIKTDADKAQEYVQQLSYVFRYTLQNKEIITLDEELKFTCAYAHLMQIRYGDSLIFKNNIASGYNDYSIVPLSIQTLVENAIKHNVVSHKQPLEISITSINDHIVVSNPVQAKKEPEVSAGIGLANLAERYRLMWKREIKVERSGEFFRVHVPLIKV